MNTRDLYTHTLTSQNTHCRKHIGHDAARSTAYRWGEDGLMGFTDRECRLCFALALWNGKDPILKERLFGLTGDEGNHGEDVKEIYYYLESTPTHTVVQMRYLCAAPTLLTHSVVLVAWRVECTDPPPPPPPVSSPPTLRRRDLPTSLTYFAH